MSEPFTIGVCRRCHGWARWQDQITGFCKTGDRWDPAASHDVEQVTLLPLDLITPLVEALEFYGDSATWMKYTHSGDPWFYTQPLVDDEGKRARAALAALPELKAQDAS